MIDYCLIDESDLVFLLVPALVLNLAINTKLRSAVHRF